MLQEHRVKASSITRPLAGRLSKRSSCVCSNYRASPGLPGSWVPWLRQPPLPPRAGFSSAGAPCSAGHSATGDSDDSAMESGTGEPVPRAQHSHAAHPCWDLCQQPGHRPALPRGKDSSPSWLPLPADPTCTLGSTSRVMPGAGASSLAHTCPLVTVLPARRTPPHPTAWGPTGDTEMCLGQSLCNSESSRVCPLAVSQKLQGGDIWFPPAPQWPGKVCHPQRRPDGCCRHGVASVGYLWASWRGLQLGKFWKELSEKQYSFGARSSGIRLGPKSWICPFLLPDPLPSLSFPTVRWKAQMSLHL